MEFQSYNITANSRIQNATAEPGCYLLPEQAEYWIAPSKWSLRLTWICYMPGFCRNMNFYKGFEKGFIWINYENSQRRTFRTFPSFCISQVQMKQNKTFPVEVWKLSSEYYSFHVGCKHLNRRETYLTALPLHIKCSFPSSSLARHWNILHIVFTKAHLKLSSRKKKKVGRKLFLRLN